MSGSIVALLMGSESRNARAVEHLKVAKDNYSFRTYLTIEEMAEKSSRYNILFDRIIFYETALDSTTKGLALTSSSEANDEDPRVVSLRNLEEYIADGRESEVLMICGTKKPTGLHQVFEQIMDSPTKMTPVFVSSATAGVLESLVSEGVEELSATYYKLDKSNVNKIIATQIPGEGGSTAAKAITATPKKRFGFFGKKSDDVIDTSISQEEKDAERQQSMFNAIQESNQVGESVDVEAAMNTNFGGNWNSEHLEDIDPPNTGDTDWPNRVPDIEDLNFDLASSVGSETGYLDEDEDDEEALPTPVIDAPDSEELDSSSEEVVSPDYEVDPYADLTESVEVAPVVAEASSIPPHSPVEDDEILEIKDRIVIVTGDRGTGVTTEAATRAAMAAEMGTVLLVDLDTKKSGLLGVLSNIESFISTGDHSICSGNPYNEDGVDILAASWNSAVNPEWFQWICDSRNYAGYSKIIIDCPIENLGEIVGILPHAKTLVMLEGSPSGIANYVMNMSDRSVIDDDCAKVLEKKGIARAIRKTADFEGSMSMFKKSVFVDRVNWLSLVK